MAIINWIMAHEAICAGLAVGIIDLIIALAPGLEANGILHALMLFLKGKSAQQ